MNQRHPNCRSMIVPVQQPKVWDIIPPLGWNWTEDDWRMYNFFRDLDFRGGVLSGGLVDRYVLLKYNRKHPSKSLVIYEDVPNGSAISVSIHATSDAVIEALAQVAKAVVRSYHESRS